MIIFHHFLNDIYKMIVKIKKKKMKNDEKKCYLKKDKVEHVHFLNDENHTQIVSPGKKKLIRPHVLKHE